MPFTTLQAKFKWAVCQLNHKLLAFILSISAKLCVELVFLTLSLFRDGFLSSFFFDGLSESPSTRTECALNPGHLYVQMLHFAALKYSVLLPLPRSKFRIKKKL
jgi:hypothetical protein